MTKAKQVQQYLQALSRGSIKLTDEQAENVVAIVKAVTADNKGTFCKLFRWNAQRQSFEFWQKVEATPEQIQSRLAEAKQKAPAEQQYMWECFINGLLVSEKIYTVNPCLF